MGITVSHVSSTEQTEMEAETPAKPKSELWLWRCKLGNGPCSGLIQHVGLALRCRGEKTKYLAIEAGEDGKDGKTEIGFDRTGPPDPDDLVWVGCIGEISSAEWSDIYLIACEMLACRKYNSIRPAALWWGVDAPKEEGNCNTFVRLAQAKLPDLPGWHIADAWVWEEKFEAGVVCSSGGMSVGANAKMAGGSAGQDLFTSDGSVGHGQAPWKAAASGGAGEV